MCILFTIHESQSESGSVMSDSLRLHGLNSSWNSLDQNTGMGSLSLLQGIFPTHGSNPGLLHCRRILSQMSHKGSSRILEWVAYRFSADLPNPGAELGSPVLQADSLPSALSSTIHYYLSIHMFYILLCYLGQIKYLFSWINVFLQYRKFHIALNISASDLSLDLALRKGNGMLLSLNNLT